MEKTSKPYEKAYSGYKLSYAHPEDGWLKQRIIRGIERLTGKGELQDLYEWLHENGPDPFKIWGESLERLNITVDFDEKQLDRVPKEGPVIFVANHPYGIVDGAIFLYLVSKVRKDYFLLINEVISREPILKSHLLPVDFRKTEEAKNTNLETRRLTTERLNQGQALVIFPSGAVATRPRFKLGGPAKEWPWRRFICGRIHETKCKVVPIYFHGQNSFWFHFVSKFSMNLRLGLLIHEVLNKQHSTIQVEVGDPIGYEEMQPFKDRQQLIEFLEARTMALKDMRKR